MTTLIHAGFYWAETIAFATLAPTLALAIEVSSLLRATVRRLVRVGFRGRFGFGVGVRVRVRVKVRARVRVRVRVRVGVRARLSLGLGSG